MRKQSLDYLRALEVGEHVFYHGGIVSAYAACYDLYRSSGRRYSVTKLNGRALITRVDASKYIEQISDGTVPKKWFVVGEGPHDRRVFRLRSEALDYRDTVRPESDVIEYRRYMKRIPYRKWLPLDKQD